MNLTSLISGRPVFPAGSICPHREKTVCISGHREKSIPNFCGVSEYRELTIAAVKLMLYRYIDMAAEHGYVNFISGLAVGTDLWAAEYILKKRRINSDIRLIGAMPYLRHAERFPREYRKLLAQVESEADFLVSVNDDPDIIYGDPDKGEGFSNSLYRDRNYYMVDRSAAVIAFLNSGGSFSGTAQTVNYAKRTGRMVCRYGIDDVFAVMERAGDDIRSIGREITFIPDLFDKAY